MEKHTIFIVWLLISSSVYVLNAGLDCDRAELLVKHIEVMRELKTNLAAQKHVYYQKPKKNKLKAPTDVHRTLAPIDQIITGSWGYFLNTNKEFIDSIIACERQHADNYYVFYHAQRQELRVFQDFLKEIYEYMQVNRVLNDFHFLRFWQDMPWTVDANTFIDENNKKGPWNDSGGGMNKLLLSVNLALFGSCTQIMNGECTFDYFLSSKSIAYFDLSVLFGEVFKAFGFNGKYIHQLGTLPSMIYTTEGTLFQIFVPRNLVNKCAYLSHAYGYPYGYAIQGTDFSTTLYRHKTASKPLEAYRTGVAAVQLGSYAADAMQARLIFSQDMLLNPSAGIKIYRYTMIPDQAMAQYKKKLKEITHQIFIDWLEHQSTTSTIRGTKLDSLCHYIQA